MAKTIQFLTPNARRQASDWLRRRNLFHDSKLLTLTLPQETSEFHTLDCLKDNYILILPNSVDDSDVGVSWSVRQAGTYGISFSELSYINGIPFLYQAGSQSLLEELRNAIGENYQNGAYADKLVFTAQVSGGEHYYQVTKKKGVKLNAR